GECAFIVRHQEGQGLHQTWCFFHHALTFTHGVPGQADMAAAKVAKATVYHLRRSAGGSPGKVLLLYQQSAQATACGLSGNTRSSNAAADDNHIKLLGAAFKYTQNVLPCHNYLRISPTGFLDSNEHPDQSWWSRPVSPACPVRLSLSA